MRIDGVQVSPKVTIDAVMAAVESEMMSLDNPGFCILCGCAVEGVEPDARKYECEACGSKCVYGAQELLLRMA